MKKLASSALILILALSLCVSSLAETAETVVRKTITIDISSSNSRSGEYTGEIVNDLPNGYGVFKSRNFQGDDWYYIGQFVNGVFHGEGLSFWPSSGESNSGTYINGVYSPGKTLPEAEPPPEQPLPDGKNGVNAATFLIEYSKRLQFFNAKPTDYDALSSAAFRLDPFFGKLDSDRTITQLACHEPILAFSSPEMIMKMILALSVLEYPSVDTRTAHDNASVIYEHLTNGLQGQGISEYSGFFYDYTLMIDSINMQGVFLAKAKTE